MHSGASYQTGTRRLMAIDVLWGKGHMHHNMLFDAMITTSDKSIVSPEHS